MQGLRRLRTAEDCAVIETTTSPHTNQGRAGLSKHFGLRELYKQNIKQLARGEGAPWLVSVNPRATRGRGRPQSAGCAAAARPPTSLRPVLLRLALVVEAHGTLVHAVGLHAVLATETARVVWGDRVGKMPLVKSGREAPGSSAPGDKSACEAAPGATRHQTGRACRLVSLQPGPFRQLEGRGEPPVHSGK